VKKPKILLAVVSRNGKTRHIDREKEALALFLSHFDFSPRSTIDGGGKP
jgi:hypothetical protein